MGTMHSRSPSDYQYGFDGMTRERMLEKMQIGWKSNETPCGRGSELHMTNAVRRVLPEIMDEYELQSIADAGAGDRNWIDHTDWKSPISYSSYDLVPRHEDVKQWDITTQILPNVDLILCRHVLNHLSPKLAMDALENFVESQSRYLLMTNCENQNEYWLACGLTLRQPIRIWRDCTKWWLELHDLHEPQLWSTQ